jgi:uncharacterized coiled-coil protein SlyX
MNQLTKSQRLENLSELIQQRKIKVDRLTKEINALENKVLKLESSTESVTSDLSSENSSHRISDI